jgi:formyl-CoA transferase
VLQGLRVVEIGQYVAAPLAATILADLGAEVVKVERPGGDPMRADPPGFAAWNRGKRTVELDLTREDGRRELGALLDRADLLVENLRPGSGPGPWSVASSATARTGCGEGGRGW